MGEVKDGEDAGAFDGNTATGGDEAGGAGLGPESDARYCGDPRINCTEKFCVVEDGS